MPNPRGRTLGLSRKAIVAAYKKQKVKNLSALAREFNCSRVNILQHLKAAGVING